MSVQAHTQLEYSSFSVSAHRLHLGACHHSLHLAVPHQQGVNHSLLPLLLLLLTLPESQQVRLTAVEASGGTFYCHQLFCHDIGGTGCACEGIPLGNLGRSWPPQFRQSQAWLRGPIAQSRLVSVVKDVSDLACGTYGYTGPLRLGQDGAANIAKQAAAGSAEC